MKKNTKSDFKAWVVTVDMGLGHQRATYPLASIAQGGIITLGDDPEEKKLWKRIRTSYEALSRIRSVPLIGKPLFGLLDRFQNIPPLYPIRNMSNPSFQVRLISSLIDKGLGAGMMKTISSHPLPLVSSYPVPALVADRAGYSSIYTIVCDAEINRAWVAEKPGQSRINYLVPCGRAVMRLKTYGVPDERIFLTGFPLPLELLGDEDLNVLKKDMAARLCKLDPNNRFWPLHGHSVDHFLGRKNRTKKNGDPLTITFAVGGAGAQREIGFTIAKRLQEKMKKNEVIINLVAGIREEVKDYFDKVKAEILPDSDNLRVVYGSTKQEYFDAFTKAMKTTDLLWTKPSELSFYCGLGIPIIMSPTIGSQEEYNKRWLLEIQAGIPQEDPEFVDQWLFDLLKEGRLAEAAWDAFLKARKYGTYKIYEVLKTGTMTRETSVLKR